jgi:hypothetical protein
MEPLSKYAFGSAKISKGWGLSIISITASKALTGTLPGGALLTLPLVEARDKDEKDAVVGLGAEE